MNELLENESRDGRLKPCPFCGGEAYLYLYCEGVDHSVGCSKCYFHRDEFNSDNEAIEAWNKRIEPEKETE